ARLGRRRGLGAGLGPPRAGRLPHRRLHAAPGGDDVVPAALGPGAPLGVHGRLPAALAARAGRPPSARARTHPHRPAGGDRPALPGADAGAGSGPRRPQLVPRRAAHPAHRAFGAGADDVRLGRGRPVPRPGGRPPHGPLRARRLRVRPGPRRALAARARPGPRRRGRPRPGAGLPQDVVVLLHSVLPLRQGEAMVAGPDVAIEVSGLRMRYGTKEVLDGVDFAVHRGEVVVLLGPNGAGKTTTIEILEGFRLPSGGGVRVLGEDPAQAGEAWRAEVGVVLQSWRDHGRWTVRELVGHYGEYYRPYATAER